MAAVCHSPMRSVAKLQVRAFCVAFDQKDAQKCSLLLKQCDSTHAITPTRAGMSRHCSTLLKSISESPPPFLLTSHQFANRYDVNILNAKIEDPYDTNYRCIILIYRHPTDCAANSHHPFQRRRAHVSALLHVGLGHRLSSGQVHRWFHLPRLYQALVRTPIIAYLN